MPKKKLIPELIDLEEYFDSLGIEYHHPGSKNTGRESLSIQCPFCGDHAYSGNNHCGVHTRTKMYNCWICEAKGGIVKLAMKLQNINYNEAVDYLLQYMTIDSGSYLDNDSRGSQGVRELNLIGYKTILDMHRDYLISRRFDPDYIFDKYNLRCTGPIGRWKFSLIVPFMKNGRVVSMMAADVTRKAESKYLYLSNEESVIPIGKTLYNIDSCMDTVIVTEGVTDVWRLGDGTVALGRKKVTAWQIKLLSKFRQVHIILDSDASDMALNLAGDLSAFTDVTLYSLEEGDPCDLSEDDVSYLRKEIFK